jgi:phosphatidylglycerophosphate synthase
MAPSASTPSAPSSEETTRLSGNQGTWLLAFIAILTCLISGLWIGYTSKGLAIVEGVLAGAAVTVVMTMTNMLILYRKIEEVTERLADSMGYAMQAGFLVVIALQVLLYGLWSGLVQMGKMDRARQAAEKKLAKKTKK